MRRNVSRSLDKFISSRTTSRDLADEKLLRELESLAGGKRFYPDELDEPTEYWEGSQKQVAVNAYERDPKARAACIKLFGAICSVCGFDFEAQYGEFGAGLIHVHHLRPLSQIRKGYRVNPKRDLLPICPNCHAIIHRKKKMLTIGQAQKMVVHPFVW